MLQKLTWMYFLLIGISAVSLLTRCGKETVEYRLTMDLVFTNDTDSLVKFNIRPSISLGNLEMLSLIGGSTSKIFTYDVEGVDKVPTPETCCQEVLDNVFEGSSSNLISINDSLCVNHENEKSVILSNYQIEVVSDRHFRYKYTFGTDDFENAIKCE